MKITIKNYRTLKNANIEITKNKINYILGANESGKSNLLNAIRIPDLDNQYDFKVDRNDRTLEKREFVDNAIEIIVKYNGAVNSFPSFGPKQVSWFYQKSSLKEKYNQIIKNDVKPKIKNWKNSISNYFHNRKISNDQRNYFFSILEDLSEGRYIDTKASAEIAEYVSGFKNAKFKIDEIIKKLKIDFPFVKYVEPILKAKQIDKVSYPYDSLFSQNSTLRNICDKFLENKEKEKISKLEEQFNNENERARYRGMLFDNLNTKIKEYFEKFKNIKAYPKFRSEESQVILDVVSKDNWNIDSGDENERSLGFKIFLRILTELIATEASKKDIIYIIDEPEQSLHPYLQIELLKEIKRVVNENKKLTVLLATHSPYILIKDKNFNMNQISFISRELNGESKITNANDIKELNKYLKNYKKGSKSQINYLFKIVADSSAWQNKDKEIKDKIDELTKKQLNGEISNDQFLEEVMNLWDFSTLKES